MIHTDFAVVIAHYAARSVNDLEVLLAEMGELCSHLIVVANEDQPGQFACCSSNLPPHTLVTRKNEGMNIGAWSASIPHLPAGAKWVLFLQDECRLLNRSFVERYGYLLEDPSIGMVGESINPKWDRAWHEIPETLNYPIRPSEDAPAIRRTDFYRSCIRRWGISPGAHVRHLRSLIWAFRVKELREMGGFPIGSNKEECIASEIAVSKAIEQRGLRVVQSDESHFHFFRHVEWAPDGIQKLL